MKTAALSMETLQPGPMQTVQSEKSFWESVREVGPGYPTQVFSLGVGVFAD